LKGKFVLFIVIATLLSFMSAKYAYCVIDPVLIEFLYYEPCSTCPGARKYYEVYLHNSRVVTEIQADYGDKVVVNWIPFFSDEGLEKVKQYNLSLGDWNSIVVNQETVLLGGDKLVNETYLRQIIDFYLEQYVHDVAVLSVDVSSYNVVIGDIVKVSVTVKNEGDFSETFNLTIYVDSSPINQTLVENLEPDEERLVVFCWNTSFFTEGNYTLTAEAVSLPEENDIADNLCYSGTIEVRSPAKPPSFRHDIKISYVNLPKKVVYLNEEINLTVRIENVGSETEFFSVKVFLNESLLLESSNSILEPNRTLEVSFTLNFSSIAAGKYVLKVLAGPVENEMDTKNNVYTSKIEVKVKNIPAASADDALTDASAVGLLVTAFILGFFETFSPCLIIMLSFIASYTFSSGVEFKEGFARIMIFGAGFVSATAIIGLAFGLILFSVPTLHSYLMLAVCAFAIIFGLHLLGLLKLPSLIQTKPLIRKIARRYVSAYIGIFLLGFIFYFLDPCIAPIFASMASILFSEVFLLGMLIFCIGAMIPFIGIGLFTSSISKITRKVYRYRHIFRGISGLILLGYALYLIFIFVPYLV